MFSCELNWGAAAALFVILGVGAGYAAPQPPEPGDWARDALRIHGAIPGPSHDALFIARSIDGPAHDAPAAAPLPGMSGHARDRVDHRRRDRGAPPGDRGAITLPSPVGAAASPVPVPPAAPLLFAALGGLALLGRRAHGKDGDRGASEA